MLKKITNERMINQPINFRTGGSTFKNTSKESAWRLIDKINFSNHIYDDDLYHISSENLLKIIRNYNNDIDSLMIIAHNPGLTNFVNLMTDLELWNLPTTGLVAINFNVDSWEMIDTNNGKVFCKKFPKELKK